MKSLVLALALFASSTAMASVRVFDGGKMIIASDVGRTIIMTELKEMTVQITGDEAQQVFEKLEVPAVDTKDAVGTIEKNGRDLNCRFLSKNEPNSGLYTYNCTIQINFKGEAHPL